MRIRFITLGIYLLIVILSAIGFFICRSDMCGILYMIIPGFPWILSFDYFYEILYGPSPYMGRYPGEFFMVFSVVINGFLAYGIGIVLERALRFWKSRKSGRV